MASDAWYVHIQGETFGPLHTETMTIMLRQHRLQFSDWIWCEPLPRWTRIGDIPQFTAYLSPYPSAPLPQSAPPPQVQPAYPTAPVPGPEAPQMAPPPRRPTPQQVPQQVPQQQQPYPPQYGNPYGQQQMPMQQHPQQIQQHPQQIQQQQQQQMPMHPQYGQPQYGYPSAPQSMAPEAMHQPQQHSQQPMMPPQAPQFAPAPQPPAPAPQAPAPQAAPKPAAPVVRQPATPAPKPAAPAPKPVAPAPPPPAASDVDKSDFIRRHIRVRMTGRVTIEDYGDFELTDISEGGAFIKSTTPIPFGTDLKFRLQADALSKPIDMTGIVIREGTSEDGDPGFAIQFTRVNPAHRRSIQEYVKALQAQAA